MNFVADEGVDRQIVTRLREERHAVWYVAEMERGILDDTVLEQTNQSEAVLITADHDFGEMVFREQRVAFGVILIRLAGISPSLKPAIVADAITKHGHEMPGAFTVISPGAIRIRRLPA